MGNITEARQRITEAKLKLLSEQESGNVQPVRLDLKNLGLTDSDLEVLLPEINSELPTISELNLMFNQLRVCKLNSVRFIFFYPFPDQSKLVFGCSGNAT